MRTTLTIDDDLLLAAKEIGAAQHRSAGEVLSEWARRGIHAAPPLAEDQVVMRNGFEVIPARDCIITTEFVRQLQDETEDL